MDKREITCICCPLGCSLEVSSENNIFSVKGNSCKRGEDYGIKECSNPTRILTTTVQVLGGSEILVPVKTESDIPKALIYEAVKSLKNIKVQAPVKIGDIIVKNILNTGVNIVASKNVNK